MENDDDKNIENYDIRKRLNTIAVFYQKSRFILVDTYFTAVIRRSSLVFSIPRFLCHFH